MDCDFPCDDFEFGVSVTNPARQTLIACGYDKDCYISTAKLLPSPYTTQALIQARLGGLIKLIEACDDSVPPLGDLVDDALVTYNAVVSTVTTEINGYLASIYPCPLAQTGTVAIIKVTAVDDAGAITEIEVIHIGSYATAPDAANTPAYLRHIDPESNHCLFPSYQQGTGAVLTVTYADSPVADESGATLQAKVVTGTPVIATAGAGYALNELLVLTGGTSFVPAKVRTMAVDLVCHSLYKRRLAPEEKNPFSLPAKTHRDFLEAIGEGEKQLDGTYKRFFSVGSAWVTRSIIGESNSL